MNNAAGCDFVVHVSCSLALELPRSYFKAILTLSDKRSVSATISAFLVSMIHFHIWSQTTKNRPKQA